MISKATVVFGGPATEHDISILTGLQAERVLAGAGVDGAVGLLVAHRPVVPRAHQPRGARLPRAARPRGRSSSSCGSARKKGTGFYLEGGLGGGKLLETGAGHELLPRRRRRVRRRAGAVRAARAQGHRRHRRRGGARHGQARLRRRDGVRRRPVPEARRCCRRPSSRRSTAPTSSSRASAAPDRHRGRRGLGDRGRAARRPSPDLREGAVVEPNRPDLFDLNVSVRTAPTLAVSEIEKPLRPADGAIFSYAEKYLRPRACPPRPASSPPTSRPSCAPPSSRLASRVVELTGLTGIVRIDFLSDGTEAFVNEVNSIPGALSLYLWPDTPPADVLVAALEEAERARPAGHRQLRGGCRPPRRRRHRRQARRSAAAAALSRQFC